MRFRRPSSRSDEDSNNDTTTVESSDDSDRSEGLFANQFSDSTDCERSYPALSGSSITSYGFVESNTSDSHSKRKTTASLGETTKKINRKMSKTNSRTPLLAETKVINVDGKMSGYLSIPESSSEDSRDDGDGLLSSVPIFENYKYSLEHKRKQSSLVTVFAVWNTVMGSSLLTMAWGIERAGLIPAVLIMVSIGGLCLFTSYTLLNVCYYHGDNAECEVPHLCRKLLGKWAEKIAQLFSFMVMLGANIVYWVLLTNFLYYSVNYFIDLPNQNSTKNGDPFDGVICPNKNILMNITSTGTETSSSWGGKYWDLYSTVPLYGALIVFPLLNFNSATFFTKFNSLGTLSVLYLVIFVFVKGWGWGIHIDSWAAEFVIKTDFTILSGMLALSFYIHNIIISIMRNNKHQENNGRDLSVAFVLVLLTYMLVGALFYICFPLAKSCIEDNILNNFAKSDILTAVARILLLFQVVTVYPLIAYMLRVQCLGASQGANPPSRLSVILFNAAVVTVCILFACFVPRIGTIIRYTGAISGLVHVFALPSLLQMKSLYLRRRLNILKIIFYTAIFIIGALNLIAQFFVGD